MWPQGKAPKGLMGQAESQPTFPATDSENDSVCMAPGSQRMHLLPLEKAPHSGQPWGGAGGRCAGQLYSRGCFSTSDDRQLREHPSRPLCSLEG